MHLIYIDYLVFVPENLVGAEVRLGVHNGHIAEVTHPLTNEVRGGGLLSVTLAQH